MSPQHKNVLMQIREYMLIISTIVTMAGMSGIFIKIGGYKEKIDMVCDKIKGIEITIDANANENRKEHQDIYEKMYNKK